MQACQSVVTSMQRLAIGLPRTYSVTGDRSGCQALDGKAACPCVLVTVRQAHAKVSLLAPKLFCTDAERDLGLLICRQRLATFAKTSNSDSGGHVVEQSAALATQRILEWPRVCSHVANFASTTLGRRDLLRLQARCFRAVLPPISIPHNRRTISGGHSPCFACTDHTSNLQMASADLIHSQSLELLSPSSPRSQCCRSAGSADACRDREVAGRDKSNGCLGS